MTCDVIAFGEVLWDIIDGVPNLGGAPLNFAAHARRCGMKTAIVSAVGADDLGERTRARVREEGVVDSCLFESELPTGTVIVSVKDGIPSYDIRQPVAWDRIAFPADGQLPPVPRAFYYGTLAARDVVSRATLMRMLDAYGNALTFYDVNLRQSYWDIPTVKTLLGAAGSMMTVSAWTVLFDPSQAQGCPSKPRFTSRQDSTHAFGGDEKSGLGQCVEGCLVML